MKPTGNHINLEELAGGAFAEKMYAALMEIAENIQDYNTSPTAKRTLTATIKFTPDKSRQFVTANISVVTKLAPAEEVDTKILMGRDLRTGQLEVAEYDGQIRGQLSIDDVAEGDAPIDLKNREKADSQITPFKTKEA